MNRGSINVYDNFIGKKEFEEAENIFCKEAVHWHYNHGIVYPSDIGIDTDHNFQFVHSVYRDCEWATEFKEFLYPIFEKLDVKVLLRSKINLRVRSSEIYESEMHLDFADVLPEDVPYKVAIFYFNTNDGYTFFENGERVESVANRAIIFDGRIRHGGTNCTNDKTRIVLNVNYI